MNPTPQQFTPAHFLSAARRAEAEGKIDLAMQFYRHVLEQYASAPEAADARDGFARLSQGRKPPEPRAPSRSFATEPREAARVPPPSPPPLNPSPAAKGAASSSARERPAVAVAPPRPAPVAVSAEADEAEEFKPAYRVGRVLAILLGIAGFLAVIAGIALGVATTTDLLPAVAAKLESVPGGWIPGLTVSGAGVAAVFVSQLALALFDGANASRELAWIERARMGR